MRVCACLYVMVDAGEVGCECGWEGMAGELHELVCVLFCFFSFFFQILDQRLEG